MGKIEIKGVASKTIEYDLMQIELNFHARENTPSAASKKALKECEDYLKALEKGGTDISKISLMSDRVEKEYSHRNDSTEEYYIASRVLIIVSTFDMKTINNLHALANDQNIDLDIHIDFKLSNEDAIREELYIAALKDAQKQADSMAEAIGKKLIGLESANKNQPRKETGNWMEVLCQCLCEDHVTTYETSDKLGPSHTTLSEEIYTTWEIG